MPVTKHYTTIFLQLMVISTRRLLKTDLSQVIVKLCLRVHKNVFFVTTNPSITTVLYFRREEGGWGYPV